CGVDPTDTLYHVLYIAGFRGCTGSCSNESNREVGWNYFHDNLGYRAVNIYNDNQGSGSNSISGHSIHDNVILNQTATGIALLGGVVGENWVYNNLLINVGQGLEATGIYLHGFLPSGTPPTTPFLAHVFNNTILNAGTATGSAG